MSTSATMPIKIKQEKEESQKHKRVKELASRLGKRQKTIVTYIGKQNKSQEQET